MKAKVWQIYLSKEGAKLPKRLEEASKSVKTQFQDDIYKLLCEEELREFIQSNYPKDVLWAYDLLNPYAYKCDLGRYCLLYKYGGWYFDISIICKKKIEPEINTDMLVFRDELKHSKTSWAVSNGIIWSKPSNKVLETSINEIVRNCLEKWYGKNPLYPTGPVLFGESIAKSSRNLNIIFGDLICPKIPFTKKGIPFLKRFIRGKFILPDGEVIGLLKSSKGGDLSGLGAEGTNNYNELWMKKKIYKDIPILPKNN